MSDSGEDPLLLPRGPVSMDCCIVKMLQDRLAGMGAGLQGGGNHVPISAGHAAQQAMLLKKLAARYKGQKQRKVGRSAPN